MYRHCAFLGDEIAVTGDQGHIIFVRSCVRPECPRLICPSSYPGMEKYTDSVCSFFRAKSVMNSFDRRRP